MSPRIEWRLRVVFHHELGQSRSLLPAKLRQERQSEVNGAAAAANAARLALVPLVRDGGQAQYIAEEPSRMGTALTPVLEWMEEHLERELSLATIAGRARTSTRTLSRRFKEQTGMTPLGWVLSARVRRAQALLESTTATIEEVAARVGFESAATLRGHFHHLLRGHGSENSYPRTSLVPCRSPAVPTQTAASAS